MYDYTNIYEHFTYLISIPILFPDASDQILCDRYCSNIISFSTYLLCIIKMHIKINTYFVQQLHNQIIWLGKAKPNLALNKMAKSAIGNSLRLHYLITVQVKNVTCFR